MQTKAKINNCAMIIPHLLKTPTDIGKKQTWYKTPYYPKTTLSL